MQQITNPIQSSSTIRTNPIKAGKGQNGNKRIGGKYSDTPIQSAHAFDFLNTEFKEIPALQIGILFDRPLYNFNNDLYEIGIEETIKALYKCMLNYAKIRGVELTHLSLESSIYELAMDFNSKMNLLMPKGVHYNVEFDYAKGVHIVLYKVDSSWDSTMFFIPIEPLYQLKDILSEKLFKLVFEAVTKLIQSACIPLWDEGRFSANIEMLNDEAEEMLGSMHDEDEVIYYQDIASCIEQYCSSDAKSVLKLLKKPTRSAKIIRKHLENYKAKSAFSKSMKQLAIEALDLVIPGENLHNYDYHPYSEDYGEAVSIDNLMIAVWADDDLISQKYLEWVEMDANEFGACLPTHTVRVTENSTRDIEFSEWPDQIAKWVHNFNEKLSTKI